MKKYYLLSTVCTLFLVNLSLFGYEWKQCPYTSHFYSLTSSAKSWEDAEAEAQSLGGHLVTIRNQQENDWIASNFSEWNLWIGLYQLPGSAEPGEGWVWVSGDSSTYRNWYPGEPSNSDSGEHHAEINHAQMELWNDEPGATVQYGIVEIASIDTLISNISVLQRTDGSKLVDIYYNLYDVNNRKCVVNVQVSDDGGNTWTVPAATFSGNIGSNISCGSNKKIVWNAGTDLPGALGNNYQLKIIALAEGVDEMTWVYINDSGVDGHEGFNSFISKYETTNAQYCEYLNAALASGDIIVDDGYVKGANGFNAGTDYVGGIYYRLDGSGYTGDGAINGGASRINYTGTVFNVDAGFENHPVTYVSWYGSTAFCNYYSYKLPTEWEWQAIADYDGSYTYGCGTSINSNMVNYYGSTHPHGTTTVGTYGAYGYGICDMAGNVWEWTESNCASDYYVLRGGGWRNDSSESSVSYQNCHPSHFTAYAHGFRVCSDILSTAGSGLSNIFAINNRNAITISATNNWDGTVEVTWTECGTINVIRQEESNPSNEKTWLLSGNSKLDKYELSEFKKKYIYIIKELDGNELGRTSQIVRPDIVIVLVRGYSFAGDGYSPGYWASTEYQQQQGLTSYVKTWFEERNITCWDASGYLNGTSDILSNSNSLKTFINLQSNGFYENAEVSLVGHSMGGLISRQLASDLAIVQPDTIKSIFCIQTPHTGSPLAEIRGLVINNLATYCLYPSYLSEFNKTTNIGKTELYSTFSDNYWDVLGDLKVLAAMMGEDYRFRSNSYEWFYSGSDGAVPKLSSMGLIREREDGPIVQKVKFTSIWDSNLDHSSSYKHPNVLNKIMDWLGYPQTVEATMSTIQSQVLAESESEETPLYHIAGFDGFFDSTHSISEVANIGMSARAYFRANISDANSVFTLVNPNSFVISPITAESDPNIIYQKEGGIQAFEIINPVNGVWALNLTTLISEPNGVEYGLTAFENQFVEFIFSSTKDWINTGQSVLLKAEISDNLGRVTGAIVTADVILPDSTVQNINLYDNGTNGDTIADDGIYNYNFTATNQEGTYAIQAHVEGTASSGAFERAAATSFTASPKDIIIDSIEEKGIDLDGNQLYDSLQVSIFLDILTSDSYCFTASVFDDCNNLITLLNTGPIELETFSAIVDGDFDGNSKVTLYDYSFLAQRWQAIDCNSDNNWCSGADLNESGEVGIEDLAIIADNWLVGTELTRITVDISASKFAEHDSNGPFRFVDIEIRNAATGLIVASLDDYMTSPYLLSEFEPLDSDGDGLPDALEQTIGTSIKLRDSDNDGATDYQEVAFDGDASHYNSQTDSNPTLLDTDGDGMTDGYEIRYGLNPLFNDTSYDLDGDGLVNIEEVYLYTQPDKIDTDCDGRNDKWEIEHEANPIVYEPYDKQIGDIDLDAITGISDLYIMANQWLGEPSEPSADIAPYPLDGKINLLDFAVLSENWLNSL